MLRIDNIIASGPCEANGKVGLGNASQIYLISLTFLKLPRTVPQKSTDSFLLILQNDNYDLAAKFDSMYIVAIMNINEYG